MADISLFQAPNGDEFNIKDTTARSAAQQAQSTADSKISSSLKGVANGVAELDANCLVPSSQLPSYVDDVLEYASKSAFPSTGETGKIYVDLDTNLTYRWSGSAYVEISPSLALGETSSTAYRGDRGKTAYDHATESGKVSSTTAVGLYKIGSTAQGHISSLTAVTKSDITALGIRALDNNTFDTISVTDLTAGDVVVTGVGRFTNGLYGNLTGNADTATNVAWNGVTGKPSTYPPSPHSHAEIYTVGDYRSSATTPNDYKNMLRFQGLKSKATIDSPSSDTYSYLLGLRGWADNSGGDAWELAFNNSGINVRHGATTTWGSWTKLLDSSNYNDYAPTKTGTGASGTWGISISGNATTATKATQDESGNNIKANYAASFSISDHTITLKNKNGASLGTVTVPDNNTTYSLGTSGNTVTLTPSSGSAQSITVPYATSAGSVKTGSDSGTTSTDFAISIKNYFDANKSTIPRNETISLYSSSYGNGSQCMGYFLAGHDSAPYGGFFVARYGYAYYVGVDYGIYTQYPLGKFSASPTTGQVVITDGTNGNMKSSGYTIASSVPSGAKFTDTDTKNTAGSTDTSSKIFLIGATSQAANPQTYSDDQVYVTSGTLQANSVSATTSVIGVTVGVNSTTGTTGGISLYGGTGNVDNYGIAFRLTSNKGVHGYVQGNWATYFTMDAQSNRGWVFKNSGGTGNVASISNNGNAVFNGSVTVGGNAANTSGMRLVYNSTTKSLDFVFVA